MIYAGIDVNIITHERAEAAGIEAFGLWCWAMCWAQVQESDGRVPRLLVLRALSGKRNVMLAKRLVEAGLWSENDDGSWTIRNYAKKNQTKEEIQRRKEAAKKRKDEWKARQAERENASGTRSGTRSEHVPERPLPPTPAPPIQPAPSDHIGTASPPPEPVTALKSRRKPETPCPASGASAGEIRDWCEAWKIPDGHGEFLGFLDHHRKSDARWRDWAAAWRTWLKNASRFSRGARGAEATKQPFDPDSPWLKLPEVG